MTQRLLGAFFYTRDIPILISFVSVNDFITINPLCRLRGEENETYWHLATECPRLKSYREETFLDKPQCKTIGTQLASQYDEL